MSNLAFPERENLPLEKQEDSTAKAKQALQAKYFGDVALFRANTGQLFGELGLNTGTLRWAYFYLPPKTYTNAQGEEALTSRDAVISISSTPSVQKIIYPTIRLMTNETYPTSPEGVHVLTQDITITRESQTRMHTDSFGVDKNGFDFKHSRGPSLGLRESGALVVRNQPDMTPLPSVDDVIFDEDENGVLTVHEASVQPMGLGARVYDCVYALEHAIIILEEIKGREPQAHGLKGSMYTFPV